MHRQLILFQSFPFQVVHTVTKLLDELEGMGVLLPAAEKPERAPQAGPSDERSLVVREILDSERKYMQDLEVLQVRLILFRLLRVCETHKESSS